MSSEQFQRKEDSVMNEEKIEETIEGFPLVEIEEHLRTAMILHGNKKSPLTFDAKAVVENYAKKVTGENPETAIHRFHAVMTLARRHSAASAAKKREAKGMSLALDKASKHDLSHEENARLNELMEQYDLIIDAKADSYEAIAEVLDRNEIWDEKERAAWEEQMWKRIRRNQAALREYGKKKRQERQKNSSYPEMVTRSEFGEPPLKTKESPGEGKKGNPPIEKPKKWRQAEFL